MDFNLLEGMIDTHFHGLIMERKELNTKEVLNKAFESGLEYAIDIGTEMSDFSKRYKLLSKFEKILFAAGNYPSEVEKDTVPNLINSLETIIKNNKIVAIGEIGLDWHWNYGTKELQIELFEAQLELANKYTLPVLIHNRDADKEIIQILNKTKPISGGIMHCFSSDYKTAANTLDLGLAISFAGNVTYKKNISLREVASKIPFNSIFAETDSPYLSPQKVRGRTNHPGHIGYTYETLSDCQNIPLEDLIQKIRNNFLNLFNPES
ncbi:MAG: TatD family hydrolase [Spirochaetia bacterium]|jgi:TatD DNase family protein|nr:TatD family hydrolase [Spirochaetia bacterium]